MEDLEYRLKAYRLFREASQKLGGMFLQSRSAYARGSYASTQTVFYPPKDITGAALRQHFADVLGDIPVFEELPEKEIASVITLEEKITHLQQTLATRVESSFHELIRNAEDRVEVIVSFLAMLQLIKQRFISVKQENFFSEIRIERLTESVKS